MSDAVKTIVLLLLLLLELVVDVISFIVGAVIFCVTMPFVLVGLAINAYVKRNKDV